MQSEPLSRGFTHRGLIRCKPLISSIIGSSPAFKGRRAEDVIAWFTSRPQAERDHVEVVVMDMSKTYASAIQQLFGEQVHVMDRFHVVHQAVGRLDEVL